MRSLTAFVLFMPGCCLLSQAVLASSYRQLIPILLHTGPGGTDWSGPPLLPSEEDLTTTPTTQGWPCFYDMLISECPRSSKKYISTTLFQGSASQCHEVSFHQLLAAAQAGRPRPCCAGEAYTPTPSETTQQEFVGR